MALDSTMPRTRRALLMGSVAGLAALAAQGVGRAQRAAAYSSDQFTATGKAEIGFQTSSTSIKVGADIYGNNSGIRGKSGRGLGVFGYNTFADSVGVGGIGAKVGVVGSTDVSMQDTNVAEGALLATHPLMNPDTPEAAGVVGTADNRYVSGQEPAAGVYGVGRDGDGVRGWGLRSGVVGESLRGDGVHGFSESGRGGVFESGGLELPLTAQVRLVPQAMDARARKSHAPDAYVAKGLTLPREGRSGDVLVTQHSDGKMARNTMWLCVSPFDGDRPAKWAEVLVGPEVDGTA